MLVKTRSSGLVWVEWPPFEDGEVWCRGFDPDGRALTRVYRLEEGAWREAEWVDGAGVRDEDWGALH